MEATILSIAVGVGLAAACGFRIFIPMLIVSVAARADYLNLAGGFEWMESTTALIAFSTATALEIGAYYIPFVDNLLDTVSTPSAVVAGTVTAASQVADMDPFLSWSVAIVAGGGAAGAVQGLTTVTRQLSSLATAGFGNPIFSTGEAIASIGLAVMSIFVPLVAAFLLLVFFYLAARKFLLRRKTLPEAA